MATQAGHSTTYASSQPIDGDDLSDNSTYECNICYELAREPVVTMCGHLYCWPCLYRYVDKANLELANETWHLTLACVWQVDAGAKSVQGLSSVQSWYR